MKFPDLVHAVKPEPHHGMPQAASAHDTFWDFVSLMPESTHMLMWVMSDRALPRSFRTMQGFGVHTFRLVNARGESRFVKFHWTPDGGHPLPGLGRERQDRAAPIPTITAATSGSRSRPASSRSTSWASRSSPRSRPRSSASTCSTRPRSSPRSWCPVTPVGRMVLEPQPRQLLRRDRAGRLRRPEPGPGHRLLQRPAAGGPHPLVLRHPAPAAGRAELPRDPHQRAHRPGAQQPARRLPPPGHPSRPRGLRAQLAGRRLPVPGRAPRLHVASRSRSRDDKVRGKPEKFADHYSQATLFWNSQTPYEKAHIVRGFRFELTKVQVPAIRERTVSMLRNVSDELAARRGRRAWASPCPSPCPGWSIRREPRSSSRRRCRSPRGPGDGSIRGRKIAILVAPGVDGELGRPGPRTRLAKAGAVVRLVAARLGAVEPAGGDGSRARRDLRDHALGALRRRGRPRRRARRRPARRPWARRSSSSRTSTATARRSCMLGAGEQRGREAAGVPRDDDVGLGHGARRAGLHRGRGQAPQLGPRHRPAAGLTAPRSRPGGREAGEGGESGPGRDPPPS